MVQISRRMRSCYRLVDRSNYWFLHDGCLVSESRGQRRQFGTWCCLIRRTELHLALFLFELWVCMNQDLELAREGVSLLLGLLLSHHHLVCMSEALVAKIFISILEHELLKQDLHIMIQFSLRVEPCRCH